MHEVENDLPEDNNPFISHMRKLDLTKVKWLAQGQTVKQCQSLDTSQIFWVRHSSLRDQLVQTPCKDEKQSPSMFA